MLTFFLPLLSHHSTSALQKTSFFYVIKKMTGNFLLNVTVSIVDIVKITLHFLKMALEGRDGSPKAVLYILALTLCHLWSCHYKLNNFIELWIWRENSCSPGTNGKLYLLLLLKIKLKRKLLIATICALVDIKNLVSFITVSKTK